MEGADEADFGGDGGDVESGDVDISIVERKDGAVIWYIPAVDGEGEGDDGGTVMDANSRYTAASSHSRLD